jgi:hypothetical protein
MNAATQVFVAVTDELLYERPENIDTPLVPYASSMMCHHWLEIEINPDDTNGNSSNKRNDQFSL